jgi:hypothetical protein
VLAAEFQVLVDELGCPQSRYGFVQLRHNW